MTIIWKTDVLCRFCVDYHLNEVALTVICFNKRWQCRSTTNVTPHVNCGSNRKKSQVRLKCVRLVQMKQRCWEVRRREGGSVGIREDGVAGSRADGKKLILPLLYCYTTCVCIFLYRMEMSRTQYLVWRVTYIVIEPGASD